jgi:hypothetical protein
MKEKNHLWDVSFVLKSLVPSDLINCGFTYLLSLVPSAFVGNSKWVVRFVLAPVV